MANKLTRPMAKAGLNIRQRPLNFLAVSLRREACATSILPHSILQSGQYWNRRFSISARSMTTIATSPIPAEGVVGRSGSRYRILETLQNSERPLSNVYLAIKYANQLLHNPKLPTC